MSKQYSIKELEKQKTQISILIEQKEAEQKEFYSEDGDIKRIIYKHCKEYITPTIAQVITRHAYMELKDYLQCASEPIKYVSNNNDIKWVSCSEMPSVGESVLTYCRIYGLEEYTYIWNFVNSLGEWNNKSSGSCGIIPLYWCYFKYPDPPFK